MFVKPGWVEEGGPAVGFDEGGVYTIECVRAPFIHVRPGPSGGYFWHRFRPLVDDSDEALQRDLKEHFEPLLALTQHSPSKARERVGGENV